MKIKYLQVLVMPNGEILHCGMHIGWLNVTINERLLFNDKKVSLKYERAKKQKKLR